MEFVPHNAPLVVLGFLLTGFLLFVSLLLLIHALAVGRRASAGRVFVGALAVLAVYSGVLLTSSLRRREIVLRAGERKYFCEIDCHLAYSVVNLATSKTLGSDTNQATAAGTFYVVTVNTWFDARTISSWRPRDLPLAPNPRVALVVDDQGRWYAPSLQGQKALDQPAGRAVPFTQPLKPGESYETTLVFDLPGDIKAARLLLTDALPEDWLLIGHGNSFLYNKIYFALDGPGRTAAAMSRTSERPHDAAFLAQL